MIFNPLCRTLNPDTPQRSASGTEGSEMTGEADSLNFQDNTKMEVFSFPSRYNARTQKCGNLPTAQSGVERGSDARQSDTMVST